MILFVTGIDTNIGKTEATGWLGGQLLRAGKNVTTMKLVQTGGADVSEDLQQHRVLMGTPWDTWDAQGLTCPQIFKFPASPHLAAHLENKKIDLPKIDRAIAEVARHFSVVLLEGAGGIEVPLLDTYTTLDFVAERGWSVLVVTSPRLGSINHTLLTVKALQARGIEVRGLLYNLHVGAKSEILHDTRTVFQKFFPRIPIWDVPARTASTPPLTMNPEEISNLCRVVD